MTIHNTLSFLALIKYIRTQIKTSVSCAHASDPLLQSRYTQPLSPHIIGSEQANYSEAHYPEQQRDKSPALAHMPGTHIQGGAADGESPTCTESGQEKDSCSRQEGVIVRWMPKRGHRLATGRRCLSLGQRLWLWSGTIWSSRCVTLRVARVSHENKARACWRNTRADSLLSHLLSPLLAPRTNSETAGVQAWPRAGHYTPTMTLLSSTFRVP